MIRYGSRFKSFICGVLNGMKELVDMKPRMNSQFCVFYGGVTVKYNVVTFSLIVVNCTYSYIVSLINQGSVGEFNLNLNVVEIVLYVADNITYLFK